MGFFPPDPPSPPQPERVRPQRMPRLQAAQDEIPVVLPLAAMLARTEQMALVLTGLRVHRDGVAFEIDRLLRRGTLDDEAWWELQDRFLGSRQFPGRRPELAGRLRLGLELADGRTVLAGHGLPFGPQPDTDDDEVLTLAFHGGGGGGGEDFFSAHELAWLHPLPPDGPITLVLQWPDFGVGETRYEIGAEEWRAIASRVQPVWPAAAPESGTGMNGHGWTAFTPSGQTTFVRSSEK